MFKTILAIIISVTFFGILFFIIVRNLLKRKLDQLVEEEKEKKLKEFGVTYFRKLSSSYKYCVIATGEYDLYVDKVRANEWDDAAGHAIAEHAGAIVTSLENEKFQYGKEDYRNPTILIRRSNNLNV